MKAKNQTSIPLFQVDAFATKPFTGNSAAVCLLDKKYNEQWMQSVAAEMNLSETAFVYKQDNSFNLRWFTPTTEVNLCGHATLAAAHILWQQGWLDPSENAHFHTLSGVLIAKQYQQEITLDFPTTRLKLATAPIGLLEALQLDQAEVTEVLYNGTDYLVSIEHEEQVRQLQPDFAALKTIDMRGVIVTSTSADVNNDFISRFFAPAFGIDEDPVTGSAHCALAPFWAKKLGKTNLSAYQASSRGGQLTLCLEQDRVFITGQAITILGGQLYV